MCPQTQQTAGTLYVVGTPIGNIADLSSRAREVLGQVDIVAAEDTRRTRGLLSRISVQTSVIAYHDHNEEEVAARLVAELQKGKSIALVSDAGMPQISDPGLRLVRLALAESIAVVSVPGPSAVTAALSVSGLPTDRFAFEGFLPRARAARRSRLTELALEPRTLVFFESVHRIGDTLADMIAAFGRERAAVLHRELTKLHEATHAATLEQLHASLGATIPVLGEFVVVVAGSPQPRLPGEAEVRRIFELLTGAVDAKRAVALTAAITRVPRNAVYEMTRARESGQEVDAEADDDSRSEPPESLAR